MRLEELMLNNNYSEMDEKIMAKIRKETENLEIPKGLEPDEMMKKIMAADNEKKESKIVKFGKKTKIISGVMAASLMLVCGLGIYKNMPNQPSKTHNCAKPSSIKIPENVKNFKDYEELNSYIDKLVASSGEINKGKGLLEFEEVYTLGNSIEDTSNKHFTNTNEQVDGVSEADVVKTDGEYIYICNSKSRKINVLKAEGKDSKIISEIEFDSDVCFCQDMYLEGDKLVLVNDIERENAINSVLDSEKSVSRVEVYDISDPEKPKKLGMTTIDGYLTTTRMVGDMIYVITDDAVRYREADIEEQISCINGEKIEANDIYTCEGKGNANFDGLLNIVSIDINNPSKAVDNLSMLSYSSMVYVSNENIYIIKSEYEPVYGMSNPDVEGKSDDAEVFVESIDVAPIITKTDITKISYKDGKLELLANGSIDGELKDQFCIDEYEGNLRVISSLEKSNSVYVLGKDLKVLGQIDNIAEDERVYSARFDGKIGYFVTYRETDPVFSVDFSDVKNPKLLGELKLPGFSEYLHIWNDSLMLGIGEEEQEDGRLLLKVSMFDVSDKGNMKEVDKIVLPYEYSEALYNHKSIMVDLENDTFGFGVEGYDEYEDTAEYKCGYLVCRYTSDGGFEYDTVDLCDSFGGGMVRGITIEDDLYVIDSCEFINVFDRNTLEKKTSIEIDEDSDEILVD